MARSTNGKKTSMELAYQKILQKIMTEEYLPGAPLREDHVAAELGISSTPVREAFRLLEFEGWLQRNPFRGVSVRKYSRQEIVELYRLREALEGAAAAAAAENGNAADLERIEDCLEREREFVRKQEKSGADEFKLSIETDLDFHSAVAAAAHNALLQQKLDMLKAQILCLFLNWQHSLDRKEQDQDRVMEEHWMIYMAIRRGWNDLAKALMEKHLAFARESHLKLVFDSRK